MASGDTPDLHELLDSVRDTRDVVVRRADAEDVTRAVWEAARDDVLEASVSWSRQPGHDAWAAYVAACDREDAALAALGDAAPVATA